MRIAIPGHDAVEDFPDGTPPEEINRVLAEKYPPTSEQIHQKLKDPSTSWEDITFDEFKKYREHESDVSLPEGMGLIWDGLTEVATEIARGIPAAAQIAAEGDLVKGGASVAEGAARGTLELGALGAKILNNVGEYMVPGDDEAAAFSRFIGIKKLDNSIAAARAGDQNLLEDMFADEDIDQDLATSLSNILDPSLLAGGVGVGGKAATSAIGASAKAAGNVATNVGRAGNAAIEAGTNLVSGLKQKVDEAIPVAGSGRAAVASIPVVGAGLVGGTLGAGGAAAALAAPSALELAGATLRGIGDTALAGNTRIGPFSRIAMSEPGAAIGKAAGLLRPLDAPVDSAIRLAAGGSTGAALGGILGGLAEGEQGFYSGIGSGGLLGAGGAGASRLVGRLTGSNLNRAIQSDWQTFMAAQPDTTANWARSIAKTPTEKAKVMDMMGLLRGVTGDDVTIRVLNADEFAQAGGGKAAGFANVVGDKPVVVLNADKADARTLAHEAFHAIAQIDGFQGLVDELRTMFVGQTAPDGTTIREGLYSQDELSQAFKRYRSQLPESARADWDLRPDGDKAEELAAEYFSAFLEGKNPNFILKGTRSRIPGATTAENALDSLFKRRSADKLERIAGAMETRLFGDLKQSPAIDAVFEDLVKARRKALGAAEIASDKDAASYTARDLGDQKTYNTLEELGLAYTDKHGKRALATPGRTKKADKARAEDVTTRLAEIPDAPGGLVPTESGYAGKFFSPEQLETVLKSTFIGDKVREALRSLSVIIGNGNAANLTYGAATRKNQRGKSIYSHRIPVSNRDVVPYGVQISKAGNMLLRAIDLSKLRAKAERAWTTKKEYSEAWEVYSDLKNDLLDYIGAVTQGTKGTAEIFGVKKRNMMNALLGARNTRGNPLLPENFKLTEENNVWRTLRLDRLIDASPLADKVAFDEAGYERAKQNFSPTGKDPSFSEGQPIGNGGTLWISPSGHKALRPNSRSKIRLYGPDGVKMGLYDSIEAAEKAATG